MFGKFKMARLTVCSFGLFMLLIISLINFFSFQVKIGLSLPVGSTVRELREQLASDTGIPESCMLLTQIDDLGFQRTFSGLSSISEIKETDPVYCIEMPQLKDATEDVEKYILLCWVNVLTMDDHCSR